MMNRILKWIAQHALRTLVAWTYTAQNFTVGQVLTASQMNQVETNIKDHVHGSSGVVALTAAQGAGLVFLQEQTASASATIDLTTGIDSTYEVYEIHLIDILPASDNNTLNMRVSEDGGSTFKSAVANYAHQRIGAADIGAVGSGGSTSDTAITVASAVANTSARIFSCVIRLFNPAGTAKNKMFFWEITYQQSATSISTTIGSAAYIGTTNAINALRFYFTTGNITSGTFRLYGVRKA